MYFFDLLLSNRKTSSTIWIDTQDIPPHQSEAYLDVFVHNYIESLTGSELALSGDPLGFATIKTRKYVAKVDSKETIDLCGFEAIIDTDIVID